MPDTHGSNADLVFLFPGHKVHWEVLKSMAKLGSLFTNPGFSFCMWEIPRCHSSCYTQHLVHSLGMPFSHLLFHRGETAPVPLAGKEAAFLREALGMQTIYLASDRAGELLSSEELVWHWQG